MKTFLVPALVALSFIAFAACETAPRKKTNRRPPPTQPLPPDDLAPQPPTDEVTTETEKKTETTTAPQPPVKTGELPYAKHVPGKPGFVTSPYAPYEGYLDIRDPNSGKPFPPGTEMKDPYSGKTFLVP